MPADSCPRTSNVGRPAVSGRILRIREFFGKTARTLEDIRHLYLAVIRDAICRVYFSRRNAIDVSAKFHTLRARGDEFAREERRLAMRAAHAK